jgi:hypothetical protein
LDGDAWNEYFDSFERDAFRLETLPQYLVSGEKEEYAEFLRSGRVDLPDESGWLSRVRHYRQTGRWIGRVHVIRRPLTDYLRFEFAYYRRNTAAGEEVRILDLTDRPDPGLPEQDFWMFDDAHVVRMDYEPDGTQIGRELLEGADPAQYVEWKRVALANSVPFAEYCTRL